ncbi:AMP-binding protein [Pseudoalteromonas sp. SSDWG2]|uniref:AMP-binding protein n=1 Tax=Pseudoalteromonas sp. SSDWG2 TaxID=3139391 RepID=UPI003BACCD68
MTKRIDKQQFLASINKHVSRYRNLTPKSQVILWHSNAMEFVTRLLALAQLDVDIILPPNSQAQTLADLSTITEFYAGECLESVPPKMQLLDEQSEGIKSEDELLWPSNDKATNLIFFTSGSSGPAKAITRSWHAINTELETLQSTFGTNLKEPQFIAMVSHQHIYGLLFKLLWPLRFGHHIEMQTYEYPEHLQNRIAVAGKWVIVASPAQLSRLAQDNVLVANKGDIACVFSSGGPLKDNDAIRLYQQLCLPVTQVYGSTETGGIGYRDVVDNSLSPWQPFYGIEVSQSDRQLMLSSVLISEKQRLLDDLGSVLSDGRFILKGRADRTVKVAEKRINLVGMEARLNAHEWVDDCVIVRLQSGRLGALVELNDAISYVTEKKHISQALKLWLSAEFEAVCIPRKWRYLESLPYNPQGKLVYTQLEQYFV